MSSTRPRPQFLRAPLGWLLLALVAATLTVTPSAYADTGVDEVHYSFTGQTSVAIDWRGTANDVRWGSTSAYGNTTTGVAPQWTPWSSAGPFWQAQIAGLTPGATYHYSIGGGPDYTFHTPPTGSFRFDAIGDVGDTRTFGHLGDTFSAMAADDPSFVLMVGDLTYANAPGAPMSVIDQHFNDVMNSWATSAAYIPAWGNHEYDVAGSDDLRNYKGRLMMPNAQTSPGSPGVSCCGNDWGWFDAGPVRFIAYPEPWTGAWADWQSKANTLMAQAQNDPSIKYIITYGHRPAYNTGYHPGEAQLANILDGFGSSYSKYVLNINGHSHDYERFQPIQGVTHVTVGAPSSIELPASGTDPRTAFRAFHLSHMRVDVSDTGLRLQAICDDSSSKEDYSCSYGSVMDEYTIGVPPATQPKSDYYVDKTVSGCSDTGPGTAAIPFCSIAKGVSRLQPGMTLYLGNGTYGESIKPLVSGTAGAPITITAWPGRSPTVGPGVANGAYISTRSYVVLSNLNFTGTTGDGIYLTKSDHITVSGNSVTGAGQPVQGATANGISVRATNDSVVTGNTADRNYGHGVYVTNTSSGNMVSDNEASFNAYGWERNANGIDVTSPNNTVLRNVTHDNEDSGIQFYTGGDNGLAALNVTWNNGDHGIDDLNVSGGRIIGNTVFRNCTTGINVEGTSGNYTVENNVAVDNAVYPAYNGISCSRRAGNIGVWDSAPPTTTVDHNLVWLSKSGSMYAFAGKAYTSLAAMQAATSQETHGVQGDPRFADAAHNDLELTAGSPAIDGANSAIAGTQDHDVLGNTRVDDPATPNDRAEGPRRLYDDLGAYEYQPDTAPAPTGPTAALALTPTSGTAPVQVSADASASKAAPGQTMTYRFDWGDGTSAGPQSSGFASHTYSTPGSYLVKMTVTDGSGLSDTATGKVDVSAAANPPTAQLTLNPTGGTAPVQVSADASGSTDPQGQTLSYAFDWGDGTRTGSQSSATASHTFTSAGTYTVTVTVTNAGGKTATSTADVTVKAPPVAPKASISLTPASGEAPVDVTADASASTDPQGEALTYAFDWGDGSTTPAQPNATATHRFTTPGTYSVTATVTNADGLTDTATQAVSVSAPASPPTAKLSVSPTSGTAPVDVSADASASTDPQGQALTYNIDWGDGTSTGAQPSAKANHTYTTAGTYTVKLTATNTAGLTGTDTATVNVAAPVSPPTAKLSVTPTNGDAPVNVTADASGSSDPQGQTLSYSFEWGDGTSSAPQQTPTASHTYDTPGNYTITVSVTNTSGLLGYTTQPVTVTRAAQPPTAKLNLTPTTGTAPVDVTADASASTDPQGQTLTYSIDWGDGTSTGAQSSAKASHTYTAAGSYTVKLTTTNTAGLTGTDTATVTVTAPLSAPTAKLSVTPTTGFAPVTVAADASASTDPQGQPLTYNIDWGDGTTTGNQSTAKASHDYTAAGSYTVKVTVTDTAGLTSTATQTVTVRTTPAYVGEAGSASSTSSANTATTRLSAAVAKGDLAVVSLHVSSGSTKAYSVTDSGANTYTLATNTADPAGGRLLVFYAPVTKALANGATVSVKLAKSSAYRMTVDDLIGVTAVDRTSANAGTSSSFSSGATSTTSTAPELVLGVVALSSASRQPSWASPWDASSTVSAGTNYLGRAWQAPKTIGAFTATGAASGSWTAAVLTFRP